MPETTSAKSTARSIMLSRDDVDRLLHDDSPESRGAVLEKVATHYNSHELRENEQLIAEHIFRLLMKDTSTRVRATLADRMKENSQVPRDIILQLANDVEPVASPVLRRGSWPSSIICVRAARARPTRLLIVPTAHWQICAASS